MLGCWLTPTWNLKKFTQTKCVCVNTVLKIIVFSLSYGYYFCFCCSILGSKGLEDYETSVEMKMPRTNWSCTPLVCWQSGLDSNSIESLNDDVISVVVIVVQGRWLWPGARNNASSFRRSDEVCSSVGDRQRHPQVRDVCTNAAAEPRNWIQLSVRLLASVLCPVA